MEWIKRHRTLASWLLSCLLAVCYLSYRTISSQSFPHSEAHHTPRQIVPEQRAISTNAHAVSTHNLYLGKTDVYLKNNMQLESEYRNGIMLAPYFQSPGDKVIAPETVLLNFIITVPPPMSLIAHQLKINVESQEIFAGEATDASVSYGTQYLRFQLPYKGFLQLIKGKQVDVVLGGQKILLSADQVAALGSMQRCVEMGKC